MNPSAPPFSAVILAADRAANDPVAQASSVSCKALAPVAGRAMLLRVLDALGGAREVAAMILCGPEESSVVRSAELQELVNTGQVQWFPPRATPSSSAMSVLSSLPEGVPVLLTTADHALLSAEMVDYFCAAARASGCDVVAGVARHDVIKAAFPDTLRTVTRLRDGGFCGCNLFAFLTPGARLAADFWRQVERERKKPLRIVRVLGWTTVLRYLLGQLTLQQALAGLSQRMNLQVGVVQMPFAEAAVDVDKVEDLLLVESVLAARKPGQQL